MSDIAAIAVVLILIYGVLAYLKPGIALVTVPFVSVALACFSILLDRPAGLLFAGLLLLITLVIVAASNRKEGSQHWAGRWAAWMLTTIAVILVVVVALVIVNTLGAGAVLPLVFFLGAVGFVATLIGIGANTRKTVATEVLSTLGASMRQNLPLPMALECAAAGRTDASAQTFRRVKKWLVQGYTLTQAIRRGYPLCPSWALAMLTGAERVGQLPAALAEIQTDLKQWASEHSRIRPVHPLYPFLILAITFVMVLGLVTFVMPEYKIVLEEMAAGPLPQPSRILFGVVNFLVYRTHSWILLGLVPFVILVFWLRARFGVRRPEKPYLLSRVGDSLKWYLPILHWFEKNHALLQVAEMLRLSLKGGAPVNEAIGATLGLDVNIHFRKQLECWHHRVEAGDNVAMSARRCGLGAAFAWAFDATAGAVETPDILSMLETFYRSNYSYRVNLARFILWPCVIICLGGVVGFVVLAIFLPLISTIGFMSSFVYP